MFIRRPKDDRLKWGTAIDKKRPVFYTATTGKPVGGMNLLDLKTSAVAAAKRDIKYKDRGDVLTMDDIKLYFAVIDGGLKLEPRNGKQVTVNHMMTLLSSRRWVCQLLKTGYDSVDGKRTIPIENYRLGMVHLKRAWSLAFVLFSVFLNTEGPGTDYMAKFLEDTTIMTLRVTAYGWPILEPEDADNIELVKQAGLDVN